MLYSLYLVYKEKIVRSLKDDIEGLLFQFKKAPAPSMVSEDFF